MPKKSSRGFTPRFGAYLLEVPFAVIIVLASDVLVSFQAYEFLGWIAALIVFVGTLYYFLHAKRRVV